MQALINTPIDRKNIDLAKLVYALRQELDIYCLISVNADSFKKGGVGKNFFGYLHNLAISSITLSICKIYEDEKKRYELNSICGVINHLHKEYPTPLNASKFEAFIKKYDGPLADGLPMDSLKLTFNNFLQKYENELDHFKTFRDKYAAHSEYGFPGGDLPSYDVMEKLFLFGADFCELVTESFVSDTSVQVIPFDLKTGRNVKSSLKRIFQKLGFENLRDGDVMLSEAREKRESLN